MILIEEATNASCGPCAEQNPVLGQFLTDHSNAVIGVSYHAWWPGDNDPMYIGDDTMNANRIQYYYFDTIGVPTCVIAGWYAPPSDSNYFYMGSPADTDAMAQSVTAAEALTSPVTLSVNRYTQHDSEQVRVTVHALENVTGASLRVIVVEAEHDYDNAGDNGETAFYHIARKMLPSYDGTTFSIAANASKNFFFQYQYNPAWTTDQLSIIAFVQFDTDKSIRTAVKTTDAPASGFVSGVLTADQSQGLSMHVLGSPLNPEVAYTLHGNEPVRVTFSIVDILGRNVIPSQTEVVSPGDHVFDFHSASLVSGTYHVIARTQNNLIQVPLIIEH